MKWLLFLLLNGLLLAPWRWIRNPADETLIESTWTFVGWMTFLTALIWSLVIVMLARFLSKPRPRQK